MIYSGFAMVYDRLMQDIPYEGWVRYLHSLFLHFGVQPHEILDLGCGTGNVTIPLAEMGYRLTGLDLSSEMLAVAEEKARQKGVPIRWLHQDMTEMDLGGQRFDLVISMTDSLNYLAGPDQLLDVAAKVQAALNPAGWFIFDLNSAYKLREVFADNVFTLVEDDVAYIWENRYDPGTGACHMDLTFFVREPDGRYRRFEEQHTETGFNVGQVREILTAAGFGLRGVLAEGSFDEPGPETERIYFVAQRL